MLLELSAKDSRWGSRKYFFFRERFIEGYHFHCFPFYRTDKELVGGSVPICHRLTNWSLNISMSGESTSEISRKFRECAAKIQVFSLRSPNIPQAASPCVGSWHEDWVELCLILFGTVAVETFNHLLGLCCKMSLLILWYYDMFRLMLARYGCRTILRDEAAKDPRKISFFPRWMAILGWKNIDQPPIAHRRIDYLEIMM